MLSSSTTFRVCSGRSFTCLSPNVFPSDASTVLIDAASASTLTVAPTEPTSSEQSSVAGVFTSNVTELLRYVENPAFSTLTTYLPGAIWRNWYSPRLSETILRRDPFDSSVSETTASLTTAPVVSLIVPRREVVAWPQRAAQLKRTIADIRVSTRILLD